MDVSKALNRLPANGAAIAECNSRQLVHSAAGRTPLACVECYAAGAASGLASTLPNGLPHAVPDSQNVPKLGAGSAKMDRKSGASARSQVAWHLPSKSQIQSDADANEDA